MITAQQARDLAFDSEAQVERWLKALEPQIKAAAMMGKHDVCFFYDFISGGQVWSDRIWTRLRGALVKLGYTLNQTQVEVGGGLGDIDYDPNNPKKEAAIKISW